MNEMDVQVFETEVVLFPVGSSKEEILVEETENRTETGENAKGENGIKSKFARLKRSMRKRALGIL